MTDDRNIEIVRTDPRTPEIAAMIHYLDNYMAELYPAESNHLVDLDALAQPDVHFFGVRVGDEYHGCGAIMICDSGYAEVKRVFVSPKARGLGLGRQIVRALEMATRNEGINTLRLETGIFQPEALKLFEGAGFRRCSAFGAYPVGDAYSVYMEKVL